MSANLNILKSFVNEYKETYSLQEVVYEEGLVGDIKKIQTNSNNIKPFQIAKKNPFRNSKRIWI